MTVSLDSANQQQLLDRFLRYVKIDTRSDEGSESSPTTEKQKDLSRILVDELKELGCDDAEMNEWGYVLARRGSPALPMPAELPGGLRFLNAESLSALFQFSVDMGPMETEINRLNDQRLVRIYEQEWRHWQ